MSPGCRRNDGGGWPAAFWPLLQWRRECGGLAVGQNCRRRPPAALQRRRPRMSSDLSKEESWADGEGRPSEKISAEVVFIDENTPTPELPQRQPYVPVSRRRNGSGDVLYIGPE